MPSIFPEQFDSDLEIPRVDQNISEINGDTINSLRDAIFAMQKAIGLNGQGNKPSLVDRINVAIDPNGNIKKSALEAVGLVTLPITNLHVGATAGILESKLKLDHTTQSLKNSIESLKVDLAGASSGLSSLTGNFNLHVLGTGVFHDGYHIKVNNPNTTQVGVAGLQSLTIGDAINEIAAILLTGNDNVVKHIEFDTSSSLRHNASSIAVSTTNFRSIDTSVENVQAALESIDAEAGALGRTHTDSFHANGILKEINSGNLFNANQKCLGPVSGITYTLATSVIQVPGVTSFVDLGVRAGDIVEIVTQTSVADAGTYQVRAVGPLDAADSLGELPALAANELAVFHIFTETKVSGDNVTINIYKPASVPSESAPLACSVRNNETIVDTISILNPNAARVVSIGLNNTIISADGYSIGIKAGVGSGQVREIVIPSLDLYRSGTGQAQPVSAASIAERINAYVSDPDLGRHFPVSAYRVGNEVAIAHNMVGEDFTLEIADGYNGNFPMGLDAYGANVLDVTIKGNASNSYVVNGVERSTIRTAFDGYAEISSSTSTFSLWTNSGDMINPLAYGIGPGSVMHVTDHPYLESNGSYTLFGANSTTISLFAAEPMYASSNPTRFDVKFSDSNISLDVLDNVSGDNGTLQLYVDSTGKVLTHQKLVYGNNLGTAVEIIDVSRNFPVGDFLVSVTLDSNDKIFTITDGALPGDAVRITDGFQGKFKLYHPNNIDFVVVKLISGPLFGAVEVMSVEPNMVLDEALEICNLHFNGGIVITETVDTRLFGNMSSAQIRDDFIEIFSQKPISDLRSNGVARGLDLMDIPYEDEFSGMVALPIKGGVAYVNGVRVVTETQKVVIRSLDENGDTITNATQIVGINEFGTIQPYSDTLGEMLLDGYVSDFRFGKILPLFRVNVVEGNIGSVVDLRLFINNLDEKIDLIVDETNNVVGNFRSLEGALLYATNYPGSEKLTVRIMNTVTLTDTIIVPSGISLLGAVAHGGDARHQIIVSSELGDNLLTLEGDNRIENISVRSTIPTYNNSLVYITGSEVELNNCSVSFDGTIGTNSGDTAIEIGAGATKDVTIRNTIINNVYTGIEALFGTDNLSITNNTIKSLSGTGGISIGLNMGSSATAVETMVIKDNHIQVPDLASASDVRGISFNIGLAVESLRIDSNFIHNSSGTEITNGIRIENTAATGSKIGHLYITDNHLNGVKLDDNDVFGIYVTSVDDLVIDRNKLENIGTDGTNNNDVAVIRVETDVINTTITNNILKDCDCTSGIELTLSGGNNLTSQATISGNILNKMGVSAWLIVSNVANTNINNNTLVGPALQGIRVTGTRSVISNNLLTKPNDGGGTDYAFSDRAVHIQTSDVDVTNNTITGMEYSELSLGITNVNSSRERIKITGNTISGTKMSQLIQLYGEGHSVTGNRLFNTAKADSGDTLFIELNAVSNSIISGNLFQGAGSRCITNVPRGTTTKTTLSNTTIVNNDSNVSYSGTTPFGGIVLEDTTGSVVTLCMVANNRMPVSSPALNQIGLSAPTFGVYNTNSIGPSIGVSDKISIPFSAGVTSYDEDGSGLEYPHWTIEGTNTYWNVNTITTTDDRLLYFPITGIPNGAKLTYVRVTGTYNSTDSTVLTSEVFKKSSKQSGFPITSISASEDLTGASTFGQPGGGIGEITISNEVINYDESTYFVEVASTGAIAADATGEGIQVHGVVVGFTY